MMPMIARPPLLSIIRRMMTTTILPDRTVSSMRIAAEVADAATMEVSILRYNQERVLDVVANANTSHDEKNEAMEEILHSWQKTSDGHVFYWKRAFWIILFGK
jgi:hypothetical protein